MTRWENLIIAAICGYFLWRMYKSLRAHPEILSRENMGKSIATMGILALLLIGFIALLVLLVRGG